MKPTLPIWPLRFLRWFCREDLLEEIEGDLAEIYFRGCQKSPAKARRQFTWSVIKHFRPEFIKSIKFEVHYNIIAMIKNYFKIAFRNITHHKAYSIINISGMSIGLAASILILLWVQNERSYDKFHKNAGQIYRIACDFNDLRAAVNSEAMPAGLKTELPVVKDYARLSLASTVLFEAGDRKLKKNGCSMPTQVSWIYFPFRWYQVIAVLH
jgi:hypothetical protein